MAEDLQASSVRIEAKLSGEANASVEDTENLSLSGNTDSQINKRNDEETSSEGEFINVEREILEDVEENSHPLQAKVEVDKTSHTVDHGPDTLEANVNFKLMKEKIKELELQLESVLGNLKKSEDEKASLNYDTYITNKKMVDMSKYCKELELGQKLMKNQILEAEEKYNFQLKLIQEILKATELKDKELSDTRESFIALSIELDSSKERIKVLEEEAMSSVDEVHKLQEPSKHSTSQADSELAHLNPKKMEDQISNLQKELTELHGEIAEKRKIEETLQLTSLNLSMSQDNLEMLKSKVTELEQKLASQDAYIYTLTEELNLHKVSEEQTEKMLSASKEDLQSKLVDLEVLENKLQEQMKEREAVEACFKNQEMQTSSLKIDLSDLNREKVALEIAVTDLHKKLMENEEINRQLETKIKQDNQDFQKTDSLLSQALYKEELEKKLELLEQLHHTSRTATLAATNRNFEIEGLVQASISTEEGGRAQVKEDEMRLEFCEKRNMELEEQINITETKYLGAMNEMKELNDKITQLTTLRKEVDEENSLLRRRFKNYEDRIDQLESSLKKSSLRNTELEKELNDLLKTCVEHEEQAAATHSRSLELEDLINSSHSRAEDAEKRVEELEILVNTSNYRRQELEKLLSITETKHKDVSAESNKYRMKVSELVTELEACQTHSVTFEALLQAANEKESESTNILNSAFEERKIFEDLSKAQEELIYKSENRIQILQNELNSLRDERESVREEMKSSSVREKELVGKLRHLTEQLEHHKEVVEEIAARNLELNSFNIGLVKETELKLQDAAANLKQKEFEATKLQEKLKSLEEQLSVYKEQYAEASENVTSLNAELRLNATKMASLENTIEELRLKVSEANLKGERTLSDNELLTTSNSNLREELEAHQHKVNELNELLKFIQDEKEATIRENKKQLHEAVENHKQRDSEARKLSKKLLELESQLKTYEKQANESAAQNGKLEEALSKLQDMEGSLHQLKRESDQLKSENQDLARSNLSLSEELVAYDTKMNELKVALSEAIMEKEDTLIELNSCKYEMKDLMQLHNSDNEKLHLQLTSIIEEKNLLNEMYQKAKNELEAATVHLKGSLHEQEEREISLKSIMESLKAELSDKSVLETQIPELENKLRSADEQLEHHRQALEEVNARNWELRSLNENLVKDMELKQQQVAANLEQNEAETRELLERLKSLEDDLAFYKEQAPIATETVTALQEELAAKALKVVSLEESVQELKQQVSEANLRGEQTLAGNKLLATENSKLIEELESHQLTSNKLKKLLNSIQTEKEASIEQLAAHSSTIADLTEEHSRCLEIQSATESRFKEHEAQLHDAIAKYEQSDLQARELKEKLLALETQLRTYHKEASESAFDAAVQKDKLEEAHLKIIDLERLVDQLEGKLDQLKSENENLDRYNLSLSKELEIYATKINDLQVARDEITTEKEDIYLQLHSSKKEVEDVMQLLYSEKDKLQLQIKSVMEENNMLNEQCRKEKSEFEATLVQFEAKIRELKERELFLDSLVENLEAQLCEKTYAEAELDQQLRYAKEQLEHQRKALEEVTTRHLDLTKTNESLVKDSELKLQEAAIRFKQNESESKELLEKLKSLEEQLTLYKDQALESTEVITSLQSELAANALKVVSLENNVEELKQQTSEANLRVEYVFSENELLATTNSKLKEELEYHQHKVNELNELLKSNHAEKEATVELLASHANIIETLTEEHSRGLELQLGIESRLKEKEALLHEATMKNKQSDIEANKLHDKLLALETLLKTYEEQATESAVAATQNGELEEAIVKIQNLEGAVEELKSKSDQLKSENQGLARRNLILSEGLGAYETKINELQIALETAVTENVAKKEIEDLMQLLYSDKEKLQSQITSLMEENIKAKEMYDNAKGDLEATRAKLEEKLSEQKAREFSLNSVVEHLTAELFEKSVMQDELEQKQRFLREQLESQRKDLEQINERNLELNSLNEYLVKDSELKLREAATNFNKKELEAKELLERSKSLEKQLEFSKEQAVEATENVASLKAELESNEIKLIFLENKVEQLKQQMSEANLRAERTLGDNEQLSTSNTHLIGELEFHRGKVNELNEFLKSTNAEKEATIKQLASHVAKITDEHSRGLDLQSETESRLKENEAQLHEAIEKQQQRDLEAVELHEKILALETQLIIYKKQASEAIVESATQRDKILMAALRIQYLEGLVEKLKIESDQFKTENEGLTAHSQTLSEEIAAYETKLNKLQVAFNSAITEKDDISMLLLYSKKEKEDLMQLLKSDKEKLQSQVNSIMEENIMLNEMYQNTKKELEANIEQLEKDLSEQKAREFYLDSLVERIKAELSEKSLMHVELSKKLTYTEEQLGQHRNVLAEVNSRNLELNSLNEYLVKDSESQIKEAAARFQQKESEGRELLVKLKSMEEQLSFCKEEAIEAAENSASLEAELRENAIRLHYFEDKVEELEQKFSESNLIGEQTLAENELLATLNTKLKEELEANEHKVSELTELLISIHAEKESMIEQLTSRVLKLTDEHSRGLELQCAAESRYKENETQLHEAIEKLKQGDKKTAELLEKVDALATQLQAYEKHATESALVEETRKRKFEEAVSKIQNLEELIDQLKTESDQLKTLNDDLTRHNLSRTEEIVAYEKRINEMQEAFESVVAEREDISMQLRHSMKEMEDLIQLLKSNKDKVQSQVTSVMEENIVLRELYKIDTGKHEEGTVVQLEGELSEQKAKECSLELLVESIKAEFFEKSLMQDDLQQKLCHTEEQLEYHKRSLAEVAARNLELNSLNKSITKNSELKLQEASACFKQKESETQELLGKLKSVEEQLAFWKEQAIEATESAASLKAELAANVMKLASLESNIEEMKQKVSEANLRSEQTLAENELLATITSKLTIDMEAHKHKANELSESLKSHHAEKEATIEQLTSHVAKLTDEHSRGLELQYVTESRVKEKEAQLFKAIEKHKQRDVETTELLEKLLALETQLKTFEKHASESALVAETQKGKLEEAALKVQNLENLVEQLKTESDQIKTINEGLTKYNLNLSAVNASYETQINELQQAFEVAATEKEDISIQLDCCKKEMEGLIQHLKSDKEKLQSQVKSIMEENIVHNAIHHNEKKEFESTIAQLEEKLTEQKARERSLGSLLESLKAESLEKMRIQEDLQQKLRYTEEQLEYHRRSLAEIAARNLELNSLNESIIKNSELKLQEAAANLKEKESETEELLENLKSVEEQLAFYMEKSVEAAENVASLKAELAVNVTKMVSLEINIEEMKQKVSEANLRSEQTLAKNELLATITSKLTIDLEAHKHKANELSESLKSHHAEKEATIEQLTSHVAKLTDERSRGLELQYVTESRVKEKEALLLEAIEKHKQRDVEATELLAKLLALETQLKTFEKHASESALVAETQKGKLEEAALKVQNLENLVEQLKTDSDQIKTMNEGLTKYNLNLSAVNASYETQINELQQAFEVAATEKEDISIQLDCCKKEMEGLIQHLKSDKEKLQSQVKSVMEENIELNAIHHNEKKEFESTIAQLEEKLTEQKARERSLGSLLESLKAESLEKMLIQEDLQQKLRYTEEQLEYHRRSLAEIAARNLELNSLNESIIKNSELKLQEAAANLKEKESETVELLENLKSVEEQLAFYMEKSVEAAENVASLKAELAVNVTKMVSLEINIEEMKQKVSEANLRSEQTLAENELLATITSKLTIDLEAHKHKANELSESLKSHHAEKEATIEQLTSHVAKLTDERSRGLELQYVTESRVKEKEAQLHEAIEKHKQSDLESTELLAKLLALETQLKTFEKHASESALVAETQKGKLEEAALKVQNLENLVEQLKTESNQIKTMNEGLTKYNLNLSAVNASYETQINKLQQAFEIAAREKEDISIQLDCCKKELEDLIQLFKSDKEKLESQVKSVMEENIVFNAMYQNEKKEFEATAVQLEEKLTEQKARECSLGSLLESLKAESLEKLLIQEDLQQKLRYTEEQLEHHRRSLGEVAAKNLELNLLNESIVRNSELKLQEAAANFKQKVSETEELLENLKSIEEQLAFYKEQAVDATKNVASLKAELVANVTKMVSLERNIEEMNQKVLDCNLRTEQTHAENELLATTNSKLTVDLETHKHKTNELNEFLNSITAEKEAIIEKLTLRLENLTNEHSRGLELQSVTKSRLQESETQLLEAIEKHKQQDIEATELLGKVLALETQLTTYEKKLFESSTDAETQKRKLEETVYKIQDLEGLNEQLKSKFDDLKRENEALTRCNLNLTEELASYETKVNELEVAFGVAIAEKKNMSMQLHSTKKEMEYFMQVLEFDKEELQMQVKSAMEENVVLNERCEMTRKELEETIVQLKEKLSEQKARELSLDSLVESFKTELSKKHIVQEELGKKLSYAEEQLEDHRKSVAEVTERNLELYSLNESLAKCSELKLQEAAARLKEAESEARELLETLNSLEEQLNLYKKKTTEATETAVLLEVEMTVKVASLVNNVEELKKEVSEVNARSEQTLAENKLLSTSNSKLKEELESSKNNINELNEYLKSAHAEKETTFEELASHVSTIEKLSHAHSRGLELQFVTESRLKENEVQLYKAIEKHKQRDLEARELHEKLLALEGQLQSYEKQVSESALDAATQKDKLEETLDKVKDLEGLAEQLKNKSDHLKIENEGLVRYNLSLSEELVTYETKVNELQLAFDAAVKEKEDIFMQLHSSNREMEDLTQLLKSDKEKFEVQVASVVEENFALNELYQKTKKELEMMMLQLEETINRLKEREFTLHSLVDNLKAGLTEKSLMQEEIGQKLAVAEGQLENHMKCIAEMTSRNLELNSLNESLVKNTELKLQEEAMLLEKKESETRVLLHKLNFLEKQLVIYKEQVLDATKTVTSLKVELVSSEIKVAYLESHVEDLKNKISEANLTGEETLAEIEFSSMSNSKLKEELESAQDKINELNELLQSFHSEKELNIKKLTSHASTTSMFVEEHSRGLKLQFATESHLKEREAELLESIEKHNQRDFEINELQQKLIFHETQLRSYEEQASESAVVASIWKGKLEEAVFHIQELEYLVEQLQTMLDQFKNENESLAKHNLSLSQELTAYETKMNELQLVFDAASIEKEDLSTQLHFSRKEMEDNLQLLNFNNEKLQPQIASVLEENIMVNQIYQKARQELEAKIVQVDEKVRKHKAKEFYLNSVDNLKAELSEKSLMKAQILELEQKMLLAEETYSRKIESMVSAADEKDAALTAKLKEHGSLIQERDALDNKLKGILKELSLAQRTIMEQRKTGSRKDIKIQAFMDQSLVASECKNQDTTVLEKQIEELKQKLLEAKTQYKVKIAEEGKKIRLLNAELNELRLKLSQTSEMKMKIVMLENALACTTSAQEIRNETSPAELRVALEVKSRDRGFDTSTLTERKMNYRSSSMHQVTEGIDESPYVHVDTDPSVAMAFKFILGVAWVSMIIGIILGKRY